MYQKNTTHGNLIEVHCSQTDNHNTDITRYIVYDFWSRVSVWKAVIGHYVITSSDHLFPLGA